MEKNNFNKEEVKNIIKEILITKDDNGKIITYYSRISFDNIIKRFTE